MLKTAILGGPDECYRYELHRIWDENLSLLVVCMLNPSTADHEINDPTILTLIHFAREWGYGGIRVINFFAFRSSSPAIMLSADDPVGPSNDSYTISALVYARKNGGRALAALGNGGGHLQRDQWFVDLARRHGVDLICLGTTLNGAPKHPLARGKHRIPRDQRPIIWRAADRDFSDLLG